MMNFLKRLFNWPHAQLIQIIDPYADLKASLRVTTADIYREHLEKQISEFEHFMKVKLPALIARAGRREVLSHMEIIYGGRAPWITNAKLREALDAALQGSPHYFSYLGPDALDDEEMLTLHFFIDHEHPRFKGGNAVHDTRDLRRNSLYGDIK